MLVAGMVLATFGYSMNYDNNLPFLYDDWDCIIFLLLQFCRLLFGLYPSLKVGSIADVQKLSNSDLVRRNPVILMSEEKHRWKKSIQAKPLMSPRILR